jgi:5-methylcytosine-specific restriction endonuclease McrA
MEKTAEEKRLARNAYMRQWNAANREKVRASDAATYQKHKEKRKAASVAYKKRNPGKDRKSKKAWAVRNVDAVRQKQRLAANTPEGKARQAAWNAANRLRVCEIKANWRKRNPEKMLVLHANRRAKKKSNGGVLSKGIVAKLMPLQNRLCVACRCDLRETGYHLDHVIPIAAGGRNDDLNVQLLCPHCNHTKSARDPVEFMQSKGWLL